MMSNLSTLALSPFDPFENLPEPDLSLLRDGLRSAPRLRLDLFGAWAPWLEETANSASAPPDYVALALLTGASATLGAARKVEPDARRSDWAEYGALWCACVGSPSSGKTPALAPLDSIFSEIERREGEGFQQRRRDWEAEKLLARANKTRWETKARKAIDDGYPPGSMPGDCEDPEEPRPPRIAVKDATIEALAPLFKWNPRGLILFRDELAGWFGNFGKYGGDGDAAMFLERFNGLRLVIDRARAGGSFTVDRALLAILGGVQPDRLRELIEDRPDDGLLSRFLFAWPDAIALRRPVARPDTRRLGRALCRIRAIQGIAVQEEFAPINVPLSIDGADNFFEWRQRNRQRAGRASGLMAGWLPCGEFGFWRYQRKGLGADQR